VSSERRAVARSEGVLGQVDGHEALERAGAEQVPEVPAREPRAPQRQDSQLAQVGATEQRREALTRERDVDQLELS
jgi:hypothetical protein